MMSRSLRDALALSIDGMLVSKYQRDKDMNIGRICNKDMWGEATVPVATRCQDIRRIVIEELKSE